MTGSHVNLGYIVRPHLKRPQQKFMLKHTKFFTRSDLPTGHRAVGGTGSHPPSSYRDKIGIQDQQLIHTCPDNTHTHVRLTSHVTS